MERNIESSPLDFEVISMQGSTNAVLEIDFDSLLKTFSHDASRGLK